MATIRIVKAINHRWFEVELDGGVKDKYPIEGIEQADAQGTLIDWGGVNKPGGYDANVRHRQEPQRHP